MGRIWRGNKGQDKNKREQPESSPSAQYGKRIPESLEEIRNQLKQLFENCSDAVIRNIEYKGKVRGLLVYMEGMADAESIQDHALYPLFYEEEANQDPPSDIRSLSVAQVIAKDNFDEAIESVMCGGAAIFGEGLGRALILNVRKGTRRNVEEPDTEVTIRGPREGFTENLRVNTALLRFKIASPKLKMERIPVGEYTRTNVVLSYIDGLADPNVIENVRSRLRSIKIDGILESNYIEELIEDHPNSPFPTMQNTERPDTVAGHLLEGKFAILVDGTPFVLIGPITLWTLLQASEDYYQHHIFSTLLRWLRYAFLFIALYTPAFYVAITTYHQDMLPTPLLWSVAASREAIPFPALIEALIMEISFEALREAGVRLPKIIGQALSILGALVIGQAAVQAGIVSAPVVIIVSLTGIASFTIPRFNLAIAIRMLRFPLMVAAALFGLFGIIIGTMLVLIHLCQLNSFGFPYLSGVAPLKRKELKDILVRNPWRRMKTRPVSVTDPRQRRRQSAAKMPSSPEPGRLS